MRKGNRRHPAWQSFGGMSFLLYSPRVATAAEPHDVDLMTIINDNISILMNEFPRFSVEMLMDMAMRLRKTHQLIV
jgi:hypothetical protein